MSSASVPLPDDPAPPSIGARALSVLRGKLGQTEEGGQNEGEIVRWACERWLSRHRFDDEYQRGLLQWCAGSVCSAYDDAGSQVIHTIASLSAGSLWDHAKDKGWAFCAPDESGQSIFWPPQPGDIVIRQHRDQAGQLVPCHAELVETWGQGGYDAIGGNSGPKTDAVAEEHHDFPSERVLGFIRVPS